MAAGSIIVDLLMRTGSFETDTNRAAKTAQKRAKEIERAFKGVGTVIAAGVGGFGLAALFGKFAQESKQAQSEQAQLAAVLKSTGEAAGFSRDQLNAMAEQMAKASTFGAGDINSAQTRLLSYTGIVGKQFPEAMQATIDMAARMGMSVEMSAETIGRALDIPSAGLTALTRQGFRFTEEQKKLVKSLEETGRVGEAQAIVLDALKSSYGGAAAAARGTFGGAITALQEQLNDLMTGSDGSLDGTAAAVNNLTGVLGSAETKAAFASLTTALAKIIELTVTATAGFVTMGERMGRGLAAITGNLSEFDRIQGKIKDVEDTMRSRLLAPNRELFFASRQELETMRRDLAEEAARLASSVTGRFQDPRSLGDPGSIAQQTAAWGKPAGAPPRSTTPASGGKDRASEAQRYLDNLQKQLRATENLSVAETVLRDIQEKRLILEAGVSQEQLLLIAKQIDDRRALTAQREADNKALIEQNEAVQRKFEEMQAAGAASFAATRTPLEELNIELARQAEILSALGPTYQDTYERAVEAAEKAFEATKKTSTELDEFAKNAAENIQGAFGDTFYQAMNGNFKNIGDSFTKMLQRMISEALAADLTRALFGKEGKGGLYGGVLGSLGGLFGGGQGSGASMSGAVGMTSADDWMLAGMRANGGPVSGGSTYLVGERGPELFTPSTAGRVIPNNALGGGRDQIQVINNVGRATVREERQQQPDGSMLRRIILDAVASDIESGGKVASSMKGRGVNLSGGLPRRA